MELLIGCERLGKVTERLKRVQESRSEMATKLWSCKIGECDVDALPDGADFPMRMAVSRAYKEITGVEPIFLFSGWGADLDPIEREIVDEKVARS